MLGILVGALGRSCRSLLGAGVGATAGFGAGRAVALAGNGVVTASQPLSSSETFERLLQICILSLTCVVLGAFLGAVVTKVRAGGQDRPEPRTQADRLAN